MQDLLAKWECIFLASFSWIKALVPAVMPLISTEWYYTPKLDSRHSQEEKMPLMDKIKENPKE